MGKQMTCLAQFAGSEHTGTLLLETDELIFRGPPRWKAPLNGLVASTDGDWLVIRNQDGTARFQLREATSNWAHAINHPKTRIDKLGVKPDTRVLLIGLEDDAEFMAELRTRTESIDGGGRKKGYDTVFLRIEAVSDLARVAALSSRITPAGGIWLIHPKGRKDLSHDVLVGAGKAAGHIDNKTTRFSDTHTGLRFVIPRANR
jgi:hypothetical protein